ncbi:PEP-CTERM sorting domain-containing protein [Prosthecobacter sp.]|uniref:PEP-CTERM sorting domain-containing protein n=1 Tax=Prosthecobacter sp. TaxID=1965333 RepID=UPI002AB8523C|nr:PEP-CTERM sorting domain-containing protein [Prosthecobacter sp.]MDZ4405379.1 PEP-CTERM sorting domain-containing protein [Prosthecobacter sp.]
MKTHSSIPRFLCLVLALAWMHGAHASTIFWGSQFNDLLFDSNGQPLDTSYSFEIGSFGSFVPTYQNVDQWEANWKVFDRAFDPDANGWNAAEQFFVGTVNHNLAGGSDSPDANPADVFAQDEVAYLWVYNSKSIVPSSEWALVTDGSNTANIWRFPDPADDSGSYNWDLITADTPIIGGVNDMQGDGTFSVNPGTFSLQTAVVPEPGSAFLLFAAAAAHLTRRARRLTRLTMS